MFHLTLPTPTLGHQSPLLNPNGALPSLQRLHSRTFSLLNPCLAVYLRGYFRLDKSFPIVQHPKEKMRVRATVENLQRWHASLHLY